MSVFEQDATVSWDFRSGTMSTGVFTRAASVLFAYQGGLQGWSSRSIQSPNVGTGPQNIELPNCFSPGRSQATLCPHCDYLFVPAGCILLFTVSCLILSHQPLRPVSNQLEKSAICPDPKNSEGTAGWYIAV